MLIGGYISGFFIYLFIYYFKEIVGDGDNSMLEQKCIILSREQLRYCLIVKFMRFGFV